MMGDVVAIGAQLAVAAFLMYLVGELSKIEGREGYTFSIYPWITTLPETITTLMLALRGYYTAALYNSVFSAVFDLAVGLGLVTLVYGTIEFRMTDLAFVAGVSAFAFAVLDLDGVIDVNDGLMLYAILIFSIVYSIVRYGAFYEKPSKEDILRAFVGFVLLTVIGMWYYYNVEALVNIVGEKIGGIISAVLTSIPDVIVMLIYGLKESEAQAEMLGCIAHDFIENVPTAAIIAGLLAGTGIVDVDPTKTVILSALIGTTTIFVASYRRVTPLEGVILLLLFGLACYLALV